MGLFRKLASISTVGVVDFRDPEERLLRSARKAAKAEARVSDLAEQSTQLQLYRSEADAVAARFEAARLRAELDALHARYVQLEGHVSARTGPPAQRRGR